jgi:hypothetical protein
MIVSSRSSLRIHFFHFDAIHDSAKGLRNSTYIMWLVKCANIDAYEGFFFLFLVKPVVNSPRISSNSASKVSVDMK